MTHSPRHRSLALAGTACLTALGALGCEPVPEDFEVESSPAGQALLSAAPTSARPEVARISIAGSGCTATLISPTFFLTAAHCIDYAAERTGGRFLIDGQPAIPIAATWSYGTTLGRHDVALGQLQSAVAPSVATPATLGGFAQYAGRATVMGYGCTNRNTKTGGGTKRYAMFDYQPLTNDSNRLCPGDSGGPVFTGELHQNGVLVAINSAVKRGTLGDWEFYGADRFANASATQLETFALLRARSGGLEVGIDRPGADLRDIAPVADATACSLNCARDRRCKAFSYRSSDQRCWLKAGAPNPVSRPEITSGLVPTLAAFDAPGGDRHVFHAGTADACQSTCAQTDWCQAFTFTWDGTCFLKDGSHGSPVPFSGGLSGLRRHGEEQVDRRYNTFRDFQSFSSIDCAQACTKDAVCDSWTYETGPAWRCKHHDGISNPVLTGNSSLTSGVREGFEMQTDRPGMDYKSINYDGPFWQSCQAECARDARCKAWTMTTSPAGANRCWLKSGVPAPVRNVPGIISGRKGMDQF